MSIKTHPQINNQKGLALLVFVIVIALAFVTYSVSEISITSVKVAQVKNTQMALIKAKQALISYAVLSSEKNLGYFGFLPCPDFRESGVSAEGGSDNPCGSKGKDMIGLFPWASLETGILRSSTGDCFWYAVSGDYKAAPAPPSVAPSRIEMLNEDSNGSFKVYDNNGSITGGANPHERVVAIIFNPSFPVADQRRDSDSTSYCGLDYNPKEYLEDDGTYNYAALVSGELDINEFINSGAGSNIRTPPFNDQLITITRKELWHAVKKRTDFVEATDSDIRKLTEALALCVAEYGNKSGNRKLPRPAEIDFSGHDYRIDSNYTDSVTSLYFGRFPYIVDNSDSVLSVHAPNDLQKILFDKGFCKELSISTGDKISLETATNSENYVLWKNWKDHFFYAVSDYYAPTSVADSVAPWCDGSNCISVSGAERAAVVIYSNERLDGQVRNAPLVGDTDTKKSYTNYIEVTSPSGGAGNYTPTGNDIAYCINNTAPLTVESCNL